MAEIGIDISKAMEILRTGGLVAIPTETVYGLAADGTNAEAVARIFEVKNRPHFDPLILHLFDAQQVNEYCLDIPEGFHKLYEKFSPGPLTYILKKNDRVPDLVTAGNPTVAIRFPRHELTRKVLGESGLALAAPSANPFGYISPTTAAHVEEQLGEHVDYILDGGPCQIGLESTIVDLSSEKPRILRIGGISREEIAEVLGEEVTVKNHSEENPAAPGMMASHYAPAKPLMLGNVEELLEKFPRQRAAIISLKTIYPQVPARHQRLLSPKGDLKEAASHLFAVMRQLDKLEVDMIFAEIFPDEGLGKAINDRLERAAAQR